MNLGRNELLGWINQVVQCEYQSIEMLADGIAFSQILDAIHPNSVNLTRFNLSAKYPDDCLRNLRLLESGLKKLKINQPVSFEKMSQGKFQDNIVFLQWIYTYSIKFGTQFLEVYEPYHRRLQILDKQGKDIQDMSSHLIPTQAFVAYDNEESQNQAQDQQDPQTMIQQKQEQISYKIGQLKEDTTTLEAELKTQMETNWRLMHNIERSIEERNTLYLLLKQIETLVRQSENTSVAAGILSVIQQIPQDFA